MKETTSSQCCCGFLGEEEQVILCCEAGLTCREAVEDKPTLRVHSKEKSPLCTRTLLDLKAPQELFLKRRVVLCCSRFP